LPIEKVFRSLSGKRRESIIRRKLEQPEVRGSRNIDSEKFRGTKRDGDRVDREGKRGRTRSQFKETKLITNDRRIGNHVIEKEDDAVTADKHGRKRNRKAD